MGYFQETFPKPVVFGLALLICGEELRDHHGSGPCSGFCLRPGWEDWAGSTGFFVLVILFICAGAPAWSLANSRLSPAADPATGALTRRGPFLNMARASGVRGAGPAFTMGPLLLCLAPGGRVGPGQAVAGDW